MNDTNKIKVYTTPSCIQCKFVKDYLDENNVEYENVDLSKNPEYAKILFELTDQKCVPITTVLFDDGARFVIGFDKEKLHEL